MSLRVTLSIKRPISDVKFFLSKMEWLCCNRYIMDNGRENVYRTGTARRRPKLLKICNFSLNLDLEYFSSTLAKMGGSGRVPRNYGPGAA